VRELGSLGIWSRELRFGNPTLAKEAAAELEELGFSALWIPGSAGGPVLETIADILTATRKVVVATGILNVWMHDAATVAASHAYLDREHHGRFLLGLGVGHARFVDLAEPGRYQRPLAVMTDYLDSLDAHASADAPPLPRIIAALAPKMISLAGKRSLGVHPYMVPVEHTRQVRQWLPEGSLIAPELSVVLDDDPSRAYKRARADLDLYLGLPNYTRTWLRLGFTETDLERGGSDRLIDALYAFGPSERIAERIEQHRDAGADHVCLRVVTGAPEGGIETIPMNYWRSLAAGLLG
jgi:probable F420-dependent oxidoreductase